MVTVTTQGGARDVPRGVTLRISARKDVICEGSEGRREGVKESEERKGRTREGVTKGRKEGKEYIQEERRRRKRRKRKRSSKKKE